MTKFMIKETYPVWVTFVHEVEANSQEEAETLYLEGNATAIDTEIGDNIDGYDSIISIKVKA